MGFAKVLLVLLVVSGSAALAGERSYRNELAQIRMAAREADEATRAAVQALDRNGFLLRIVAVAKGDLEIDPPRLAKAKARVMEELIRRNQSSGPERLKAVRTCTLYSVADTAARVTLKGRYDVNPGTYDFEGWHVVVEYDPRQDRIVEFDEYQDDDEDS